jgi:hypothetical protein
VTKQIVLSLTVITEDQAAAVKAWEVLGRSAIGLALDEITVSTSVGTVEDDDEDGA